jgi:hypothetical protein
MLTVGQSPAPENHRHAITTDWLVDAAVTTGKLADDSVTAAKIAADAVGSSEIATDAVGTAEIAANAVGSSELADGAVDTAAVQDAAVTYPKLANDRPMCRAVWSANTSCTTGTDTAIAWGGTDAYDISGMHDPAVQNTRLTAQVAGVYSIGGWYLMAADTTNTRSIYIRLNGTTMLAQDRRLAPNSGSAMCSIGTTDYKLAVNDYVELIANQNSGGSLNVTGGAFHAKWIGPG